jgi:hypothetical protein
MGTTKSDTNDADKLMAEAEKAMEKKKIEEKTASSTIVDWKVDAKGKGWKNDE